MNKQTSLLASAILAVGLMGASVTATAAGGTMAAGVDSVITGSSANFIKQDMTYAPPTNVNMSYFQDGTDIAANAASEKGSDAVFGGSTLGGGGASLCPEDTATAGVPNALTAVQACEEGS